MGERSIPFWAKTSTTSTSPVAIYLPEGWRECKVYVDVLSYVGIGKTYTPPAVAATNGITTISSSGTPTGGTFKLRAFPGDGDAFTTAALTYDESAADVKTALIAGSTWFVTGDITAAGGALPTAITLTWTGVYAGATPPIEVVEQSLTGGTNPKIQARTTTVSDGNGGYAYVEAGTQEVWTRDAKGGAIGRYLYVAAVSGTGNYRVSLYR